MTSTQALRCDALVVTERAAVAWPNLATADRIECANVSRDARNPAVLDMLAQRDGWVTRSDGSHLCPSCATAAREVAA